tara:strand:- start:120 stop:1031 length:912 start_codon:yes stop_codon:yes gene_type:complete
MPLLTLHLSNGATPGVTTNDTCKLHLDAEIRTQDVAVKQTRVHIQDRLIFQGNIFPDSVSQVQGKNRMLEYNLQTFNAQGQQNQAESTKEFYVDYLKNAGTAMSVLHCLYSGYRCRYTLGGPGFDPATHKGILREGYYYGKRNTNDSASKFQIGFSPWESNNTPQNLPTLFNNNAPLADYNHSYHILEILDPPPFKLFNIPDTIYVEMPFSIKEEANGNVNGTSIIPVPVDNTKVTTVTNLHCVLLFEKISSGDVHLSTLDGNTPAPNEVYGTKPFLLSDSYGGVKAIDLVLEYTTNNMHSSG